MPNAQRKLTAALAALVVLVVAVSGLLAERRLHAGELVRIERSLMAQAALVRETIGTERLGTTPPAVLDAIAERAAAAAGARVTLIARDGTVVGDSDVAPERLSALASHAQRPEVKEALAGRPGSNARRSETVGRDLFYVAVPAPDGGVVRLAAELSDLEAAISTLQRNLFVAGAIGIAAALAFSYALSWYTLRPIRELRGLAASIAGGDLDTRLPLRNGDELGEISRALHQVAEQLQHRLGEATLEKERLQAVLDGMVEGVLVTDSAGTILLANQRLRDFFDAWGEMLGRTSIAAIRDAELDSFLAEAGRTDEPVSRTITRGGSGPRTLDVQAVRFPSGTGPRMGTVTVFHDITELSRLEKVRRDFVANASHELRTPLSAIRGFAETLVSNDDLSDAEQRSYVEIIDRHARRLAHIVGDLLELSEVESGATDFDLVPVDVSAVVESLIRDTRSRFAEKKLEVSLRTEGACIAWADGRAVEQVLRNLLDNALQYSEPGGRVEVGITGSKKSLSISVSDSGIGIPEEDRDRIFERFYRVDKARSRALGGTGLGLAIVKHLVQSLGGEIYVESELGEGSTFRFSLPRAKPREA